MKVFAQEVSFQTKESFEFVNLTGKIQAVVEKSGVKEGVVLVQSPHTTAAVVITEDDRDLHQDTKMVVEHLLSLDFPWKHIMEGKINARAHQAALLLGNAVVLPVSNGQITLGTWQDIFFVECLEGRLRRVKVVVMGK